MIFVVEGDDHRRAGKDHGQGPKMGRTHPWPRTWSIFGFELFIFGFGSFIFAFSQFIFAFPQFIFGNGAFIHFSTIND
ncbi:hypothetical protein A9C19_18010 [Bacillus weihaiensis]|uniref:Uncharacterized protein n=1 Tax=Bacillus weihaiensis TaxID=1547283 RepID=A0A1L3MVV4_9BACI|nr:hypothetical protein A9C19_18010 [Bacillus weihaiensis]